MHKKLINFLTSGKLFNRTEKRLTEFFTMLGGLTSFSVRFFKELFLPPYEIEQIRKMAELYLYDKEIRELDCRFDVFAILFEDLNNPEVNHYENAF
jgi:hypothetical protein